MPAPTRGRRRTLDQKKKVEICDLLSRGVTVEEAADKVNASFRTVQREILRDEDFARELRASQRIAPDPLVLMQSAARAHWRAAAWLLERTDPERYAKRPPSSATPEQFEAALTVVLEAALEATPPEAREAVYQHVQAACDQAFKCVFANYGPWGRPKNPQLPPTPLADAEQLQRLRNPPRDRQVFDGDSPAPAPHKRECSGSLPLDGTNEHGRPEVARAQAVARAKHRAGEGGRGGYALKSPLPSASHGLPHLRSDASGDRARLLPPHQGDGTGERVSCRRQATPGQRPGLKPRAGVFTNRILSPKMHIATKFKPGDRSSNQRLATSPRYRDGAAEALRQAVQCSGANEYAAQPSQFHPGTVIALRPIPIPAARRPEHAIS